MANAAGQLFGDRLSVSITVPGRPGAQILFWAEPPYVNAGGCAILRWDVQNVSAVYLDGQPVIGQGQQQVCPCERTTYTLRVVKQDGQAVDQPLAVDVYGACATVTIPPPTKVEIEFSSDAPYVNAGSCTTLRWRVEGVREVYLDDEPVVGQGSKQVCPCAPETHTLHVIKRDGQTVDRALNIGVYGKCETKPDRIDTPPLKPPESLDTPFNPLLVIPPQRFFVVTPEPLPTETQEVILW